ncbi:MAG: cryptochrome/photolyase family protein [Alphaproteobacteria bacterium]
MSVNKAKNAAPVIVWLRSDLRLADNPALFSAAQSGHPVLPVFILDDESPQHWKRGGASRWWLHQSLLALDAALQKSGFHPLVCMAGAAGTALDKLIAETSARGVYWNRCYEPWAMTRDKAIKENLKSRSIDAQSFSSFLMFEPWEIVNKTGGDYKVFTPFSKACLERGGIRPPVDVAKPAVRHSGDLLAAGVGIDRLGLMPKINWYGGMAQNFQPGECGAWARMQDFVQDGVGAYKAQRDFPALDGVSRLSPHLHFGEISPHQIWHAVQQAMAAQGPETQFAVHAQGFLRQLIWREFSYHLLYHAPDFPDQPWNKQFAKFPWHRDDDLLHKWQRGQTGFPIIDAGMRQLWQTGWMHNRVRMIVGSFLVKNLLLHWRDGEDWFWDTLVDADLGNNAAGWQWIAGCGADAAPYFRIFNPLLQSKKFDAGGAYIRQYVPELAGLPDSLIHTPWEAPPMLRPSAKEYPPPIVDLAQSRDRALKAYAESKSAA